MILWRQQTNFASNKLTMPDRTAHFLQHFHLRGDIDHGMHPIHTHAVSISRVITRGAREVALGEDAVRPLAAWRQAAEHLRRVARGGGEGVIALGGEGRAWARLPGQALEPREEAAKAARRAGGRGAGCGRAREGAAGGRRERPGGGGVTAADRGGRGRGRWEGWRYERGEGHHGKEVECFHWGGVQLALLIACAGQDPAVRAVCSVSESGQKRCIIEKNEKPEHSQEINAAACPKLHRLIHTVQKIWNKHCQPTQKRLHSMI